MAVQCGLLCQIRTGRRRDGIVHLSGVITEERSRQAAIVGAENVSGVKKVHDHLSWVDTMCGMYLNSPEDDDLAKAS